MLYTIIIFSENKPGVLYRIADLFLRRRINIESLTVSEISDRHMSRFTITVDADGSLVEKITKQIYRIIEVVKVIDTTDEQLVIQEVALLRVSVSTPEKREQINQIVHITGARVIHFAKREVTISMTGTDEQILALRDMCTPYGVKEFVRSGRIALVKSDAKMQGKWSMKKEK